MKRYLFRMVIAVLAGFIGYAFGKGDHTLAWTVAAVAMLINVTGLGDWLRDSDND